VDIYGASVFAVKKKRSRKTICIPPTVVRTHPLELLAVQKLSSLLNPVHTVTKPTLMHTHTHTHTLIEKSVLSLVP